MTQPARFAETGLKKTKSCGNKDPQQSNAKRLVIEKTLLFRIYPKQHKKIARFWV
jgi:hypothetical protein